MVTCDGSRTGVDALRRLALRLAAGDVGEDGRRVAAGFECYLASAADGVTLEAALGLEPGWWVQERRSRRDEALREYARLSPSETTPAVALASAVSRYAAGQWLRDRQTGLKAGLEGTPHARLFEAFSANDADEGGASMPTSVKQMRRILGG